MNQYKVWVPVGMLGSGFPDASVTYASSQSVDAIACDAGSTDPGPFYLGTGTSTKPTKAIKADLKQLMKARDVLSVPLIVGSCGTCGTKEGVDWVRDICTEIASEDNLHFKLALIYTDLNHEYLKTKLKESHVLALDGAPAISEAIIDSCSHIVGLSGAEPIMDALENGADIVLVGRATDASLISAPAIHNGIPPGQAWHGGKTAECGALCTVSSHAGGVIVHFDQTGFEIEAALPEVKSTPYSVSAHMLYENTNSFELREPSGLLKTGKAVYIAVNERRVRVEKSEFEHRPYSVKIEGSGIVGYQSLIMSGIRNGYYIKNIEQWQAGLLEYIRTKVKHVMNLSDDQYDIQVRRFGLDGVAGQGLKKGATQPQEVEIMLMVTAKTQVIASNIIKLSNAYVLHMPLTLDEELPSFAFPFSPAQIDRGPVYEFKLHHVVEPESYRDMAKIKYCTVNPNKGEML